MTSTTTTTAKSGLLGRLMETVEPRSPATGSFPTRTTRIHRRTLPCVDLRPAAALRQARAVRRPPQRLGHRRATAAGGASTSPDGAALRQRELSRLPSDRLQQRLRAHRPMRSPPPRLETRRPPGSPSSGLTTFPILRQLTVNATVSFAGCHRWADLKDGFCSSHYAPGRRPENRTTSPRSPRCLSTGAGHGWTCAACPRSSASNWGSPATPSRDQGPQDLPARAGVRRNLDQADRRGQPAGLGR